MQAAPVQLDGLHFDDKLHFVEEPVEIVDREVKRLKRSQILLVKVRWNSKREESSKQGRKIADIDVDAEVNLKNVYNLNMAHEETVLSMQDVDVQSERIEDVVKDVEDVVATAENVEGINAATILQISKNDVTLAQTLIEIKAAKPKANEMDAERIKAPKKRTRNEKVEKDQPAKKQKDDELEHDNAKKQKLEEQEKAEPVQNIDALVLVFMDWYASVLVYGFSVKEHEIVHSASQNALWEDHELSTSGAIVILCCKSDMIVMNGDYRLITKQSSMKVNDGEDGGGRRGRWWWTEGKMVVKVREGDGKSFRVEELMAGGEARENN
nr:putative reverse transcriptase domain-containing protein [Tanacetum cinerariifolium]